MSTLVTPAPTPAATAVADVALAAVSGALFAVGLAIAGMTDPANVIAFLDLGGLGSTWDPALAFVLISGLLVYAVMVRVIPRHRAQPLFADRFHLPTRNDIDRPLLAGSAMFGAGWGLAGFCPGPGIVSAAAGATTAVWFTGAMIAGMLLHAWRPGRPGQ